MYLKKENGKDSQKLERERDELSWMQMPSQSVEVTIPSSGESQLKKKFPTGNMIVQNPNGVQSLPRESACLDIPHVYHILHVNALVYSYPQ